MYSLLSFSQLAKGRTGLAELFHMLALRGFGWACFFACSYCASPDLVPEGGWIPGSPPWQSMQPRRTVPVGCMDGESVWPWQATQPVLLRSASSCDCSSRERSDCCATKNVQRKATETPQAPVTSSVLEAEADRKSTRLNSS